MSRFLVLVTCAAALACACHAQEGVILLHGLCRTASSMSALETYLSTQGYVVLNYDYPSRSDSVSNLADSVVGSALGSETLADCPRIHFVTHSLGGILVRSYFSRTNDARLGRVVMLGPPNQGSEVVDRIGGWWAFNLVNGPAGCELGTGDDSTPNQLGKVDFDLGIIAGDRSINWINSMMIEGPDDGKVSVERTKVDGMTDHTVVHTSHPFLMKDEEVLRYTRAFLRHGSFCPTNQPGHAAMTPAGEGEP